MLHRKTRQLNIAIKTNHLLIITDQVDCWRPASPT